MSSTRRRFTREFKLQVLDEIADGRTLSQVAREYNITGSMICKWRRQYKDISIYATTAERDIYVHDSREAELERLVGRLTIENELLKKSLKQLRLKN